jgi:hypothetical protein
LMIPLHPSARCRCNLRSVSHPARLRAAPQRLLDVASTSSPGQPTSLGGIAHCFSVTRMATSWKSTLKFSREPAAYPFIQAEAVPRRDSHSAASRADCALPSPERQDSSPKGSVLNLCCPLPSEPIPDCQRNFMGMDCDIAFYIVFVASLNARFDFHKLYFSVSFLQIRLMLLANSVSAA